MNGDELVYKVSVTALALCLAACGGPPAGPVQVASYAPVAATIPPVAAADYRINPLDELRIDVFLEPELSLRELPVDTNGMIQMPLAGAIKAQGRTANELSADIAQHLRRYLRLPQVAVNITAFKSQRITVGGAVAKSGVIERAGQTTLLQAITEAGGLTDLAREDEVLVFRDQAGQRFVARFDIGTIQNGLATDPTLQSGDIVVVGISEARRRFRSVLSVVPLALGLFVALKQSGL